MIYLYADTYSIFRKSVNFYGNSNEWIYYLLQQRHLCIIYLLTAAEEVITYLVATKLYNVLQLDTFYTADNLHYIRKIITKFWQ